MLDLLYKFCLFRDAVHTLVFLRQHSTPIHGLVGAADYLAVGDDQVILLDVLALEVGF